MQECLSQYPQRRSIDLSHEPLRAIMANSTSIDCSKLGTRTDFRSYILSISNATGGNFSLASDCKPEICAALWGSGNPDISGIGMTIGYVLGVAIGITLTLMFLVLSMWPSPEKSMRIKDVLSKTFEVYHNSAVFLCFSVQIASVIVLVKANFGISANGMGANTMEITWIISLLTLLPVCYGVFIFRLRDAQKLLGKESSEESLAHMNEESSSQLHSHDGSENEAMGKDKTEEASSRDRLRFLLFVLSWAISAYPFFSRMVCTFGKLSTYSCHFCPMLNLSIGTSEIGESSGSVISDANWAQIQDACYDGVTALSSAEGLAMSVFGIGGWLFLSILVLSNIISSIVDDGISELGSTRFLSYKHWTRKWTWKQRLIPAWILFVVVTALEASQVWAYFRMQRQQIEMTQAEGISYLDEEWAFGQVVAVVVFAPVLVEAWYAALHSRKANA
jgi:hypothetical protein